MKKFCPLLGVSQIVQQSMLRGNPDYIVNSYVPCMGEGCIAYYDGMCTYFRENTDMKEVKYDNRR